MNCRDFQAQIDFYLDEELDDLASAQAVRHIECCPTCEHEVTDHQKARSLLITAVADRAAAVDISGLWQCIESRLDAPPRTNVFSLAAWRARRVMRTGRSFTRRAGAERKIQWGALSAAAAAAVFMFALVGGESTSGRNSNPTSLAGIRNDAVAQSRPVRIDSMEVAAGHSVSTWVKPRTKTRVIWVANTGSGYSVTPASHAR